jgi:hypothetical protein
MDRIKAASELVKVAKDLMAFTLLQEAENALRDLMSSRHIIRKAIPFEMAQMYVVKEVGVSKQVFKKAWDGLIKDKFILPTKDGKFKWTVTE